MLSLSDCTFNGLIFIKMLTQVNKRPVVYAAKLYKCILLRILRKRKSSKTVNIWDYAFKFIRHKQGAVSNKVLGSGRSVWSLHVHVWLSSPTIQTCWVQWLIEVHCREDRGCKLVYVSMLALQ